VNRRWPLALLASLACLAGVACRSPSPERVTRPPLPPAAVTHFSPERHEPATGDCRELGWAPPSYPASYRNPGCHNDEKLRCPEHTVCCSYRCVTGCTARSDFGCPDLPLCVEESLCRPGGRVDRPSPPPKP
jgi:hypothetical protein